MPDLKCRRCHREQNTMVTYTLNAQRDPITETYCLGCAPAIGVMVRKTAAPPIPKPGGPIPSTSTTRKAKRSATKAKKKAAAKKAPKPDPPESEET